MASSCKKCKATECEECPEWIFTFADLVMLMMGFFVILWVLKPEPGKKNDSNANDYMIQIEASIREGFGYEPDPKSKDKVDMQMISNHMARTRKTSSSSGGQTSSEPKGPEGTDPEVTNIRSARQATQGGKMLFDKGSGDLNDSIKQSLDQIADLVAGHRNIILVKGHTSLDDLPDDLTDKQKFDQSLELSLRRAQAAAEYLITKGVDPKTLRVEGCSTYEPLTLREYTPDSQVENRRVEVESTGTLVEDVQGSPQTKPQTNPASTQPTSTR